MHISCKLVCFFIVSFYVFVLPFTDCTAVNQFSSHKSTNDKVYKVNQFNWSSLHNFFIFICFFFLFCPWSFTFHLYHPLLSSQVNHQKTSDITLHGLLLWASMGLLLPLGILAIRMSSKEAPGSRRSRVLFYFHVAFQMLAVLLAIVGAAMSLKKFENTFDNNHQRLGLALYGAILVQSFIGYFRPQREKKNRSYWYFIHWILGTVVSLVGIINTYTGLKAYHKRTLKSTRLWTILFTVEVSFIALLYLFQDKLEFMKKQRVIQGNESNVSSNQDIPQRRSQKEMMPLASCLWKETCTQELV